MGPRGRFPAGRELGTNPSRPAASTILRAAQAADDQLAAKLMCVLLRDEFADHDVRLELLRYTNSRHLASVYPGLFRSIHRDLDISHGLLRVKAPPVTLPGPSKCLSRRLDKRLVDKHNSLYFSSVLARLSGKKPAPESPSLLVHELHDFFRLLVQHPVAAELLLKLRLLDRQVMAIVDARLQDIVANALDSELFDRAFDRILYPTVRRGLLVRAIRGTSSWAKDGPSGVVASSARLRVIERLAGEWLDGFEPRYRAYLSVSLLCETTTTETYRVLSQQTPFTVHCGNLPRLDYDKSLVPEPDLILSMILVVFMVFVLPSLCMLMTILPRAF